MTSRTENLNVVGIDRMSTPAEIKDRVPMTERAAQSVIAGRRALVDILERRDPRLFVVVGPCSIHDPQAGLDYARRLLALADAGLSTPDVYRALDEHRAVHAAGGRRV